jgi:hypothetical protein
MRRSLSSNNLPHRRLLRLRLFLGFGMTCIIIPPGFGAKIFSRVYNYTLEKLEKL